MMRHTFHSDVTSPEVKTLTDLHPIEIVEYSDDLAEKVANMWNTWDELWIGGFTQGVPYTEKRVREQMATMERISQLIAIDDETGEAIGSCSVLQHWRDDEAAYVGLLGVSPSALNKKVGKRLLLRAVQIAIERGYARVDLNTWAGNLRALPLYKKIGLMWDPEGNGVSMQDYIPEILRHQLTAPFFIGKDEFAWYDLQKREITQTPDDLIENNMVVFKYIFEDEDNSLEVLVDRMGRGITGISRKLERESLSVHAYPSHQDIICGIPAKYTIEIENEMETDLDFKVQLSGFEGIHIAELKTQTIIKAGASFKWEVPFTVDSGAPLHRTGHKSPSITASISLGGVQSKLVTGLRINSIADISTEWGDCKVAPGGKAELPINIRNQHTTFNGTLVLTSENDQISIFPQISEIEIGSNSFGGLIAEISAKRDAETSTYDIWAHLDVETESFEGEPIKVQTRKFRIPIYCLGDGIARVGEIDKERSVRVVSETFHATANREGGNCTFVTPKATRRANPSVDFRVGPPFGIDPFRFADREIEATYNTDSTILTIRAKHPERPLLLETDIIFPKGEETVRTDFWVTNTSNEAHTFQARMYGPDGGISLASIGTTIIPLKSGIIEGPTTSIFTSNQALPTDPNEWAEDWIAQYDGRGATGQFWIPERTKKIQLVFGTIGKLEYDDITLQAGEKKRISQIWNVLSAEHWTDIHQAWRRTIEGKYELPYEVEEPEEANYILEFKAKTVVTHPNRTVRVNVAFNNHSNVVIPGDLVIWPPDGYEITSVSIDSAEVSDGKCTIQNFAPEGNQDFLIVLEPSKDLPNGFYLSEGKILHKSVSETQGVYHILQLGKSDRSVEIGKNTESEKTVYTIDNGMISFKVSPDYGGCITSLKNNESTELLVSAFPEASPKIFIENYFGGVQPVFWTDHPDDDLVKAKTNLEQMEINIVDMDDIWKGVELSWTADVQKFLRGLDFKIQYLTAPRSPMIIVTYRIKNNTSAPFTLGSSFFIDNAFNGDLSNMVIESVSGHKQSSSRLGDIPTSYISENNIIWTRKDEPKSDSEGLGLMIPYEQKKGLLIAIRGLVLTSSTERKIFLKPGDEQKFAFALLVDPPNLELMEKLRGLILDLL
ncbi:MAG: GNAT family N-acetyltransferase [Candidatus Lokiarchaeota archaeon]|nr:GNAT family N-acetyltransferase [Candidatus Lokiarchaeota archaeon]